MLKIISFFSVFLALLTVNSIAYAEVSNIYISLKQQQLNAYDIDGNHVFSSPISSGKRGHSTPTGSFEIIGKKLFHRSNRYPEPRGGAPMPYMMRLTDYGIAIHAGHVPGYPASHGCIRLPKQKAKELFAMTPRYTAVYIED